MATFAIMTIEINLLHAGLIFNRIIIHNPSAQKAKFAKLRKQRLMRFVRCVINMVKHKRVKNIFRMYEPVCMNPR
jgi:hypothetical protein